MTTALRSAILRVLGVTESKKAVSQLVATSILKRHLAGAFGSRVPLRDPGEEDGAGCRIRQGRRRGAHLLVQGLSSLDRTTFAPPPGILPAALDGDAREGERETETAAPE